MSNYPFNPGHVRGSETSKAAAESVKGTASSVRKQILAILNERGTLGATDYEIEQTLGLIHQTASARRRELVLKGEVIKTPTRRKTGTGRTATVWISREHASVELLRENNEALALKKRPTEREQPWDPDLDPETEMIASAQKVLRYTQSVLRLIETGQMGHVPVGIDAITLATEQLKRAIKAHSEACTVQSQLERHLSDQAQVESLPYHHRNLNLLS